MAETCKGCGEPMENIRHSLSRYGHGEICSECGVREALKGNFIAKYSGLAYSLHTPAEWLEPNRLK